MGQQNTPSPKDLPSRPKFSWDPKSPPWTDGIGDQEEYRDSVSLWQTFHNALPVNNSNKIPAALQAVYLKSQLYGRAKDLCSGITDDQLVGEDSVALIVGAIYKRDALSVVSEAYKTFNQLLNTSRGNSENMKNFESRFAAQVAKFNSISNKTKLPECLTALMLLSNSSIDDAQRVSAMAAASPSDKNLNSQSSNDQYLSAITYSSVASVIKQCDKAPRSTTANGTLTASSGRFGNSSNNRNSRSGDHNRISPTMKYPCDTCGKYGHWKRNHRADGSLAPGVKSFDNPQASNDKKLSSNHPSATYGSSSTSGAQSLNASKQSTLSFNMATFDGSTKSPMHYGPLLDSGAPYSAIGIVELNMLADHFGLQTNPSLEPIPEALSGYNSWQYGTGSHASQARDILGSIVLTAKTDNGNPVQIRHLVLDGSSQWLVGRNVTSKANIENIVRNALVFVANGTEDCITIFNHNFLSFIKLECFLPSLPLVNINNGSTLSCMSAISLDLSPWTEVKRVIDKIHKHVCGHASFSDYKLLLDRNDLWNDVVSGYLTEVVSACTACRSTSPPAPSRKVSIRSLSREFNEVLAVDHFYLEGLCVLHFMDPSSRYSAAYVVNTTALREAVIGFEATWVAQFWYPDSIIGDTAFNIGAFKDYADALGIPIKTVTPR